MNTSFDFIKETDNGSVINIKLVPNSSFSKIVDYGDEYIRIKIASPALENRANKELISFLSDILKINKSKLEIISGEKSKLKKVLVKETSKEYLLQKFSL